MGGRAVSDFPRRVAIYEILNYLKIRMPTLLWKNV
jgi:hypothetical protein